MTSTTDEVPPPEPQIPPEMAAALAAQGELLLAELKALDAMPQVDLTPAAVFDRGKGAVPNKRGVICKLVCCGCQLDMKCNATDRPTPVEAARHLRAKVAAKHGSAECLTKAAKVRAARGASSTTPPEHAFAALLGAQLKRQRATTALATAEQRLQVTALHAHCMCTACALHARRMHTVL